MARRKTVEKPAGNKFYSIGFCRTEYFPKKAYTVKKKKTSTEFTFKQKSGHMQHFMC